MIRNKRTFFVIAGLLTGTLPFVQVQSLLVIFIVCLFYVPMTIFKSKKFNKNLFINWLIYASITVILAPLAVISITGVGEPQKFIRFHFGWTSEENIFWFWLKNLGVFAPVLIASIIWIYKKNKNFFFLYLPFLSIFFICNLFVFQPWKFDNSKFLIYWYFVSSALVAYYLYLEFFSENMVRKILGTIIVFFMILSGSLDIFRTFTKVTYYQIFTNTDIQIAEIVKNTTPKNALFITAPIHNHPITALAGRSTLLGFYGWVWSHGLDYQERSQDIAAIYSNQNAELLINKYKINYVTIGPLEREKFSIDINYFRKFPKISLNDGWDIYDVSNIWSNSNWQNRSSY